MRDHKDSVPGGGNQHMTVKEMNEAGLSQCPGCVPAPADYKPGLISGYPVHARNFVGKDEVIFTDGAYYMNPKTAKLLSEQVTGHPRERVNLGEWFLDRLRKWFRRG